MRRAAARVRPRRAKARYPLALIGAVIVTLTIVGASFGIIAADLLGGDADGRPQVRPTPSVAAPPGAGAGQWQLPERRWEPLPLPDPSSPLYAAQVNGLNAQPPVALLRCSEPATVETRDEWEAAVRDQWYCVHRSWVPTFHRLGWSTVAPAVQFFVGAGDDSACGYLEAPAFYCSSGEGSVHFGARHFDMARTWNLSVHEMVNHEYGHHLQNLAGVTAAKLALPWSLESERRAELQATCWSAAMTYRNTSFPFAQEEYDGWLQRLETMEADGVHGSRESLVHWGTRGLYAVTMNDCNTWVVLHQNLS